MATTTKQKKIPTWLKSLRGSLKAMGKGWTVAEHNGRVRLCVRFADGQRQAVVTDLPWASQSTGPTVALVASLRDRMHDAGIGLRAAYDLDQASEDVSRQGQTNWPAVVEQFQRFKINSGAVSERTWHRNYRTPMDRAVEVLTSSPRPTNAREVLDGLVARFGGEPGTTGRRLRIQYVSQMLSFAVAKAGADQRWMPPTDLKEWIGIKTKGSAAQTTYIQDDQIVRLLAGITDPQWRLAISAVAAFGLRPVELHCISANTDGTLHVAWRKRTQKCPQGTPPRNVIGLDPVGLEGLSANVLAVLQERGLDALPVACRHEACGDRLHQFLERKAIWKQLQEEVANTPTTGSIGNELVPYSLRHAWSRRASEVYNLTDKVAAQQMGHSLQTHHSHYSAVGVDMVAAARAQVEAINSRMAAEKSLSRL